jgi:hypothetical protein
MRRINLLLLAFVLCSVCRATDYYVDVNWPGIESGTEAEPYNTIGQATAAAAAAEGNHTIYIKAGNYPETANTRLVIPAGFNGKQIIFRLWPSTSGTITISGSHTGSMIETTASTLTDGTVLKFYNFAFAPTSLLSSGIAYIRDNDVDVYFEDCSAELQPGSAYGWMYATTGGTNRDIAFIDCNLSSTGRALYIAGANSVTIANGCWSGSNTSLLKSINTTNITGLSLTCSGDCIGLEVSGNCSSMVVSNNTFDGAVDQRFFKFNTTSTTVEADYIRVNDNNCGQSLIFGCDGYVNRIEVCDNTTVNVGPTRWYHPVIIVGRESFVPANVIKKAIIKNNTIASDIICYSLISVGYGAEGTEVINNKVISKGAESSQAIQIFSDHCIVRGNQSKGRDAITLNGASYCFVENNTAYSECMSALWIKSNSSPVATPEYNTLRNNIFLAGPEAHWALAVDLSGDSNSQTWFVKSENNCYYKMPGGVGDYKDDLFIVDANSVYRDAADPIADLIAEWTSLWPNSWVMETGSIVADPQFIDAANGDFRLKPTSPCLNAGMSMGGCRTTIGAWQPASCEFVPSGDLNNDFIVDFYDFAEMAKNWLIDCTLDPNDPACVPE